MTTYIIINEYGDVWKTRDEELAQAFIDAGTDLVISLDDLDAIEEVPADVAAYLLEEDCPDGLDVESDEEN